MFASPDYLCMVLPSTPTAIYAPVSPYPCPAYRSSVCLPGYNPSQRVAWRTADIRHHVRKSSLKNSAKSQKLKSFSIEAILSDDKFEASKKQSQPQRCRSMPFTAGLVDRACGTMPFANFNFIKDVHGQATDGTGYPVHRAAHNAPRFKDEMMRSYGLNVKPSRDDVKDPDLPQHMESWSLNPAAVHEKSKRVRTIFTSEQLQRLEKVFEEQQYMVGTERLVLASELQLSEAQVKVWFQNRRIKWRKESHEKNQAKLADYRSRRDEIRKKLGLSQRRRITPDEIKRKRNLATSDVTLNKPIDSIDDSDEQDISKQ